MPCASSRPLGRRRREFAALLIGELSVAAKAVCPRKRGDSRSAENLPLFLGHSGKVSKTLPLSPEKRCWVGQGIYFNAAWITVAMALYGCSPVLANQTT